MQDAYRALVRDRIGPPLRALGLRKQGRATWWEQRDNGSWVLLALVGSRHSTPELVEFHGEVAAWPPGTWEFECDFHGQDPGAGRPYVAANVPIDLDSRVPLIGEPGAPEWRLAPGTDPRALGAEVTTWAAGALERARRSCDDVEAALNELVDGPGWAGWRPTYAIAMLRAVAPDHPRLPEIVEARTESWRADPRPITLRSHLVDWRAGCGLPEVDLPTFWSPSMQRHSVERFGSAQAAFRAGFGTSFLYADGSESTEPPSGWLDEAPPPVPESDRRTWWPRRR
jgi:hypothetical protein